MKKYMISLMFVVIGLIGCADDDCQHEELNTTQTTTNTDTNSETNTSSETQEPEELKCSDALSLPGLLVKELKTEELQKYIDLVNCYCDTYLPAVDQSWDKDPICTTGLLDIDNGVQGTFLNLCEEEWNSCLHI